MKIKRKTKKKKIQLDGFWKNLIKYTIIFGVIAVLITGFSLIHYSITSMPINYDTLSLDFSSVIYAVDQDGNPVHYTQVHDEENRLWVSSEDIPLNLKNAFVAIEDERFYKHGGVDIPRTIKATLNFVFRKDDSFGGSTINQQLVKNLTGNRQKSVERKATEIIRAIHLDSKLEKDQILELYLNTIYLSQGCYGVKTASEKYFDKDVKDLTLAECASIASITQLPTMYDPILNPDNNKEKQERVLGKMLELKMISEEEYEQAKN
ncbi:MAG: transglycosylase domain-containing protein, partial [Clostridia bacterium]|nr:transglycosylase domain-containing protein [Clostridia bacterium]